MKQLFLMSLSVFLFLTTISFSLNAQERRTDGKPGSEYADFSGIEGTVGIGAQFGTILPVSDDADAAFALGFDIDYRPYELFGVKFNFLQGLKSPKISLISITPSIQTEISNLTPYAFFGPGVAIANAGGTELKFLLAGGAGADVQIVKKLSIGLVWTFDAIFDSYDTHSLTARFGWKF